MTVTKEQASEALDLIWSITHSGEAERTLRQFIEQSTSQDSGHAPAPAPQQPILSEVELLRQGAARLRAWHAKYGEHRPQWLPPAGDVRWLEDVDAALARSALAMRAALSGALPAVRAALAGTAPTPLPASLNELMAAADKYWEASTAARYRVRAELEAVARAMLGAAPTQAPQQPTCDECATGNVLLDLMMRNRFATTQWPENWMQVRAKLIEAQRLVYSAAPQSSRVHSGANRQQPTPSPTAQEPVAARWERRRGHSTRLAGVVDAWSAWQACTEAEAKRVTGLRTWEVRRLECFATPTVQGKENQQ